MEYKDEVRYKDDLSDPAHIFLTIVQDQERILSFLPVGTNGGNDMRWISYRLLYISKWYNREIIRHYNVAYAEFDQTDDLWRKLLEELKKTNGQFPEVRSILLEGVESFRDWIRKWWFSSIKCLWLFAYTRRMRAAKYVEIWKYRAGKPGTILYKRIVSELEKNFNKGIK